MRSSNIRENAKTIKENIGLETYPVGVKFVFDEREEVSDKVKRVDGHRYCQALMRARHGEHVLLDGDGIACPAAARAFGFKPLPDGLKSGKGLVKFGIVQREDTGKEMFKGMTTFDLGEIQEIHLFPLEEADFEPDVVVIEGELENLMWISLAYLNAKGGERVESSTAILQATCVDATIIPYKEQKMNLSYGCYGCRDATDIESDESVLGFPFKDLEAISDNIDHLSKKAVPNSREKNAYKKLKKEYSQPSEESKHG
ncbi:MAG: DUF169 domain-containing protein [Candidatus Thermoplasmatota archaeon]|nr:DUF169 domain-containing protein [Candidatus Thermoplasmatota archaeon]